MMIGKVAGKSIYIHISAIDGLSTKLQTVIGCACGLIPTDFKWNFVIAAPEYIAFVLAENFDRDPEPVLGERWKVYLDESIEYVERSSNPRILHQKYKTVKNSYRGFDLKKDKDRESWYKRNLSKEDMEKSGYQKIWRKLLSKIEEPFDEG